MAFLNVIYLLLGSDSKNWRDDMRPPSPREGRGFRGYGFRGRGRGRGGRGRGGRGRGMDQTVENLTGKVLRNLLSVN